MEFDSVEADIFRDFLNDEDTQKFINTQILENATDLSTSTSLSDLHITTGTGITEDDSAHGGDDLSKSHHGKLSNCRDPMDGSSSSSLGMDPTGTTTTTTTTSTTQSNTTGSTTADSTITLLTDKYFIPGSAPLPSLPCVISKYALKDSSLQIFSEDEFLSRLGVYHSQLTGKPVVNVGLVPSLLFPERTMLHICTAMLGLSSYCYKLLFEKLVLFQHLWNLDPNNTGNTLPFAKNLVLASLDNVDASLKGHHGSNTGNDTNNGTDSTNSASNANNTGNPPLIYGSTIHRFYATIFAHLDAESRLFFLLLSIPPCTSASIKPIPPNALKQYFLVDLPGLPSTMHIVKSMRTNRKLATPPSSYVHTIPTPDTLVPVSQRHIYLTMDGVLDLEKYDYENVSTTPIPFDPLWLQYMFLEPSNWVPLLLTIIDIHPGLEFLASAGDFQHRYGQTVISRIYYNLCTRDDDKLMLGHLKRSDMISKLERLANAEDVNRQRDEFSYEHFYVLYCKFWELDDDHDMQITTHDLIIYDDGSLGSHIIERIADPLAITCSNIDDSNFTNNNNNNNNNNNTNNTNHLLSSTTRNDQPRLLSLTYEDFVKFFIAEIDKSTSSSVRYWLRRLDFDNDTMLGANDVYLLLQKQGIKVREAGGDHVNLADLACQLYDMLHVIPDKKHCTYCKSCSSQKDTSTSSTTPTTSIPVCTTYSDMVPAPGVESGYISARNLLASGLAPTILDLLFNLSKYVQAEARDVSRIRAQQAGQTEWERWAAHTYYMLAGSENDG